MLCLLLWCPACALTRGPVSYLDKPDEMATQAYGGWMEVSARGQPLAAGELIAVSTDSVWVLVAYGPQSEPADSVELQVFPWSDVIEGTLVAYNSGASVVTAATVMGAAATASHGRFFLFSAPLWILTGTVASRSQRDSVIRQYPGIPPDDLRPFCRFPQGIPPGLDRSSLRLRPYGG
jgi:hypothetical protein